jgi:hypothetical protein
LDEFATTNIQGVYTVINNKEEVQYVGNSLDVVNHIKKHYEYSITDYFKPASYDLHKFVNVIKKPKIIKAIQEPFYFTLIHYLVFASIWLEFSEVQQLWYAISWLKIIKDKKLCSTVVLGIKSKNNKPIFSRLKSNTYSNAPATLKRKSSMSSIRFIEMDSSYSENNIGEEEQSRRYSVNTDSHEFLVMFDLFSDSLTSFDSIVYLGSLTALELLEKINSKITHLDVHKDFIKSYTFLKTEMEKYFRN